MEVTRVEPSPIQHILVHKMRLYCRYSAVSGTTTGASLSLAITEHTLHTPNGREDVVIKSAATMNALTNIKKQQLHPLNCLIRLVIQYRSGPAPVPVPVPVPVPFPFPFPSRFRSRSRPVSRSLLFQLPNRLCQLCALKCRFCACVPSFWTVTVLVVIEQSLVKKGRVT